MLHTDHRHNFVAVGMYVCMHCEAIAFNLIAYNTSILLVSDQSNSFYIRSYHNDFLLFDLVLSFSSSSSSSSFSSSCLSFHFIAFVIHPLIMCTLAPGIKFNCSRVFVLNSSVCYRPFFLLSPQFSQFSY